MKKIFKQKKSIFKKIIYCVCAVVFWLLIYFLIWRIFTIDGPFNVGDNIDKRDWLLFLSGFLTFVGTVTVSIVAVYQNKKYKEMDVERFRSQNEPYLDFEEINFYDEFDIITFGLFKASLKDPNIKRQYNAIKFDNTTRGINATTFNTVLWNNMQFQVYNKQLLNFVEEKLFNYTAIYKISNLGLGAATNLKIVIKENEFNTLKRNLPIDESLYLHIDLKSLIEDKITDKQFTVFFNFDDISGNSYSLNASFLFTISNPKYDNDKLVHGTFNLKLKHVEKSKLQTTKKV